jgi:hypothetical protein
MALINSAGEGGITTAVLSEKLLEMGFPAEQVRASFYTQCPTTGCDGGV